jgi:hypothetical protein
MKRTILSGAIVALLATAGIARAAETTYTDQATFAANASGLTTINFDGIADPNGFAGVPPTGITVGGVTFGPGVKGPNNSLFVIGSNFYSYGFPVYSAQSDGVPADGENDVFFTLPTAETAVGFNFIVDPGTVTVTLSDGTQYEIDVTTMPPTTTFFGITGTTAITSIDISQPSPTTLLDLSANVKDVSFGTANPLSPVPEPSSLMLLGTGLAGFAGAFKSKRIRRS